MLRQIESLTKTLNYWVNRADYIFKIVQWSIETIRVVSAQLSNFPRSADEKENNISEPNTGSAEGNQE
jgi:hypothetical protein